MTQLAFGLNAPSMCEWLRFGRRCLLHVLQHHPSAEINHPTALDTQVFIDAIGQKCPVMREERVWAACDGLKTPIQQPKNWRKQNPLFNGWKGGCCINGVFTFSPDGLTQMATINTPGSWCDGSMTNCGICKKMKSIHMLAELIPLKAITLIRTYAISRVLNSQQFERQ